MSRKTMDEYPDIYNIWKPPSTSHPQNDDTRAKDLIDGKLTNSPVVDVYRQPWDKGHHLDSATEDFCDALWGVNEGKRDVRK